MDVMKNRKIFINNNKYQDIKRHCKQILGVMQMYIAWCYLHLVRRDLLDKSIWIICEKRNEARDNGYHLFKYLKDKHQEVNSYYVITKDSPDLDKVEALGDVLYANTWKHCIYYLAAERDISSQAYGAYPFNFNLKEILFIQKLKNPLCKTVFLQHGIIKDELAHRAFDADKNNIDLFVTSADREYEFVKNTYKYSDKQIAVLGLARFDALLREKNGYEKSILIMPTWRGWLRRKKDGVPLSKTEIMAFKNSDFYKVYSMLLTDINLYQSLKQNGYKLYFYMHYQLQDYTELFAEFSNDCIVIADRHQFDVQELLIKTKLLVTDFSSVFFDFAYANKPVIYYQFDEERFRENHYSGGYFVYEKDGFGPCIYKHQELVSVIVNMVENNCAQISYYEDRVNNFFSLRDQENCKRNYEAIKNL